MLRFLRLLGRTKIVQTKCGSFETIERIEPEFGGASRDRTDGLVVANDALSQLSYSPTLGVNRLSDREILAAIPAGDQSRVTPVDCGLRRNTPTPCHSEAGSIGEESAVCQRRNSRFPARQSRAAE